jgi:hypothetical protein
MVKKLGFKIRPLSKLAFSEGVEGGSGAKEVVYIRHT